MAQYLNIIIVMTVLITLCSGSAIPMWEFLSRGEKVRLNQLFFKKLLLMRLRINETNKLQEIIIQEVRNVYFLMF